MHEFPLGVPRQTPKLLNTMFCQDILVCIQCLLKNTIAGTTLHVLHEVVVCGSLMCLSQGFLNILFCAVKVPCFMKTLVSDAGHRLPIRVYTLSVYNQPGYKYSQGDVSGLQAGHKRKGLSNFIQDNMRAKT